MKLTKSVIEQLIREVLSEEDVMDKTIKYKDKEGNEKEATVGGIIKQGEKHPAYKDAKRMVDKGGEEKPDAGPKMTSIDKSGGFGSDDDGGFNVQQMQDPHGGMADPRDYQGSKGASKPDDDYFGNQSGSASTETGKTNRFHSQR